MPPHPEFQSLRLSHWFSGIILACHAGDPSSILGCDTSWKQLFLFANCFFVLFFAFLATHTAMRKAAELLPPLEVKPGVSFSSFYMR